VNGLEVEGENCGEGTEEAIEFNLWLGVAAFAVVPGASTPFISISASPLTPDGPAPAPFELIT